MAGGPIADAELDLLFVPLAALESVGLAVSGGPDSTALMHLFARWRGDRRLPRARVLTVDHGLRPESAEEARLVVRAAKQLGLEAEVLGWAGKKPVTGLQEAAREARYRLLADAAVQGGLAAIITAHTEDDQAETLLMRLARGSGLDGLAGMPEATSLGGVRVLRPLLGVAKARLVATLDAAAIGYASDPSNADSRFERSRLRAAAPVLVGLGLTSPALASSARRLERARKALEAATDDLARSSVTVDAAGVGSLDLDKLAHAPEEIAVRLVARLVAATGGEQAPVSLAKVEALTGWLTTARAGGRTLGRAEIQVRSLGTRRAVFLRETGRQNLPVVPLEPGHSILWDGRFRVWLASGRLGVVVAPAGPDSGGKESQAIPAAMREGRIVASPLDAKQALIEGLTFKFAGHATIFGPEGLVETQK